MILSQQDAFDLLNNGIGNDLDSGLIRPIINEAFKKLWNADNRFFYYPSSRSGKYHPVDECSEFGLLRHTIRAYKIGDLLCKAHCLSREDSDIVKASCLLHDIFSPCGAGHETKARIWLTSEFSSYSSHTKAAIDVIGRAIQHHMGPFTDKEYRKPLVDYTEIEIITYHADSISSKRDIKNVWKFNSMVETNE